MSTQDLQLVMMLAKRVGIKTVGELDQFKNHTGATTNEQLIKKLALYVGTNTPFAEVR